MYLCPFSGRRQVPPPRDADLSPVLRVTESPLFAGALILISGALLAEIGLASGQQWYQFGRLLNESRLVHVTALDLFTLTFSLPFWMYTDADARGLKQQQILPLLIALPVIGPGEASSSCASRVHTRRWLFQAASWTCCVICNSNIIASGQHKQGPLSDGVCIGKRHRP